MVFDAITVNSGSVDDVPKSVVWLSILFGPIEFVMLPAAKITPDEKPMFDAVPLKDPRAVLSPENVILDAVIPVPNRTF